MTQLWALTIKESPLGVSEIEFFPRKQRAAHDFSAYFPRGF